MDIISHLSCSTSQFPWRTSCTSLSYVCDAEWAVDAFGPRRELFVKYGVKQNSILSICSRSNFFFLFHFASFFSLFPSVLILLLSSFSFFSLVYLIVFSPFLSFLRFVVYLPSFFPFSSPFSLIQFARHLPDFVFLIKNMKITKKNQKMTYTVALPSFIPLQTPVWIHLNTCFVPTLCSPLIHRLMKTFIHLLCTLPMNIHSLTLRPCSTSYTRKHFCCNNVYESPTSSRKKGKHTLTLLFCSSLVYFMQHVFSFLHFLFLFLFTKLAF